MIKVIMLTCAGLLAAITLFAGTPPGEEQFGDRVYFLQDSFESGNYSDYFQSSFLGYMKRNIENRKGYCVQVTYGESRPFNVEPGKKYHLEFYVFNEGAKNTKQPTSSTDILPFLAAMTFYDNTWNVKKQIKGTDVLKPGILPAEWRKYSFDVEAPANASMFTFNIGSSCKANAGPYLLDDLTFTQIKEQ
ncbi:MAG: hypothetical protein A2X49_00900 [Lentisphaerae bacterium GWF2_52_8]|nr:MAG: hypothetical protein A2X49_00900 [Lentisphaerae bacterium GWF2_52_8]